MYHASSSPKERDLLLEIFGELLPLPLCFALKAFCKTTDQKYAFLVACERCVRTKDMYEVDLFNKANLVSTGGEFLSSAGEMVEAVSFTPHGSTSRGISTSLNDEPILTFYKNFMESHLIESQREIFRGIIMEIILKSPQYRIRLFARGFAREIE